MTKRQNPGQDTPQEPKNDPQATQVAVRAPRAAMVQRSQLGAAQQAEALIAQAIDKGVPVETMERLLNMRRELKAEYAKEAYDSAMAAFQGECPVIEKKKDAKNRDGKVMYAYAPLDSIIKQVGPIIGRHGLSYTFKTENKPDRVTVTCIVKHREGHSEESTMETSLATKTDIMSGPQVIAATVTFNKRYAFVNAFGIMTGDEDTDAAIPDDDKKRALLDSARKMIGTADIAQLREYGKKLKASAKYTEDQKAELLDLVDGRMAELKSNHKDPEIPIINV